MSGATLSSRSTGATTSAAGSSSRMIAASADHITLTDLELRAYNQALEPKQLVMIEGGHFDPYLGQFAMASAAAMAWFHQHLTLESRNAPSGVTHGERKEGANER